MVLLEYIMGHTRFSVNMVIDSQDRLGYLYSSLLPTISHQIYYLQLLLLLRGSQCAVLDLSLK